MKHNVSGSSLLHNVNNSSSTLSTPRGVSGSGAPPQQRGRTTVSSSAASQRSFSASSAAAAHVARTRSGSANRSALGDRSYQQQVVPGTQHGVVKPATWTSTPIREDGRPDVSRSTSCATATQQHVDPLQHSAMMIATSAPSASSVAAQHSLLIDELSAVDSFSFGNDAVGSVRLDYVSGNTSTSATAPATATTVGGDIDASNVSASSHRYVSPFGLRDPVTLRIDRTSVTVARTSSSSSSSSLSTPSSSPAANVVMTIAFTSMARVELRRDGSLLLRRADHQEVVVSMHSAPKVVAAYKILTVRCRGAFPKNTEDATYTIERHLQAFASAAPVTAADDSATTTTPPLPPAVAALQPAATGGATSSSSSRRIASSSPSLPQRSSSSSSARKSSPQVSSVVSSVLHVDIPPVQLPPPRTIPNRTAKTPISATLARGASNGAAAASADDTDSNVSPRLGAQSSASLSPKPHVRVVHNLSSPSASSTSAIASREERRLQLRAQLLSLRKDRPLPS